ncbi:(2,3-dihydroxybenzoyl)adenylate synthase [Ramlibacter rhizophilus]|uniref:(2,3-dihydroxybenzoyl)adenylate synthase n=1 Tax=Ramlibacter rhizophilus TaxID=1781167 RepID=A0A4Z0BPN7_9BURK|nr:AMP-binding protein [Ramlibacter rhizophilus]TFZ01267.1 (2,3-dihydroxybenzoyl)adenylate synthase [Ramlibacter rhizophilus]
MLEGFVPFPPEYVERYRARGYWQDKSLAQEFDAVFKRFADRVALVDGEREFTYAELDRVTTNLALNLLEVGLKPLDRVVPTLPNVHEFVVLYFALQKIGAIPIAALVTHRFAEISQFVQLSGATCCVYPKTAGDFAFSPMIERMQAEQPSLKFRLVLGEAGPGEHSLRELIERPARLPASRLAEIRIDPMDPCIFQLSGGTTGIPKLIPRTNNDYAYNSKVAADVTEIDAESVLLLVLPIAHNLPLACPGIQGFMFKGAKVVLHANTRPTEMFALIQKHGVTHLKVVPALLIRLINDPSAYDFELSSLKVIQSGGQRMQPEVRARTRALIPGVFVQENFGMSEGTLMFVRASDPEEVKLETCGRPVCPDDEVLLLDDEGREVPDGEVGEFTVRGPYTLRGYFGVPEYNARQFTPDGFYRSGDLMRKHPSGNYVVEGRKKDLINRGGEKISAEEVENLILMHPSVQNVACVPMPDPNMGERMCAFVIPKAGRTLTLAELVAFLATKEIAKFKLPERLELLADFPVSTFGKVSKKALGELIAGKLQEEEAARAAA